MINLLSYVLLFITIYTIIALYLDYLYKKVSASNIDIPNDHYFAIAKMYPSSNKEWRKLIINIAKRKLPNVPKDQLLSAIICYGIDSFIDDIAKSRSCFLIRPFIFNYDEDFIKRNLLYNLYKMTKADVKIESISFESKFKYGILRS